MNHLLVPHEGGPIKGVRQRKNPHGNWVVVCDPKIGLPTTVSRYGLTDQATSVNCTECLRKAPAKVLQDFGITREGQKVSKPVEMSPEEAVKSLFGDSGGGNDGGEGDSGESDGGLDEMMSDI